MVWCRILLLGILGICTLLNAGCARSADQPELVYGQHGNRAGAFVKPRAVTIDANDQLYIVDFTARIQVFDREGQYLHRGWTTPDSTFGRPSGLSVTPDGNLLVSDSHYHRLRVYTPDGTELQVLGGNTGSEPGQFGYIADAVQDDDGFFYVAEAMQNDRITKLDRTGKVVACWGRAGTEPGQFARIRAITLGPTGLLYVADACNHRIQVFTRDGELQHCWGGPGTEPGQILYPYDVAVTPDGTVYVVEYGNHRVQKFSSTGTSLGCWGGPGLTPGKLRCPWALTVDKQGRVHVLDSENHRVQRVAF